MTQKVEKYEIKRSRTPSGRRCLPVVAVDVVQPAALLHDLHRARHVLPRGEAVPPLVLLAIAGLDAAAVGALLLPAGVVVGALLRLGASQDGACRGGGGGDLGFWQTFFQGEPSTERLHERREVSVIQSG